MSTLEDEGIDFLAFPEPSPTSSLEDLSQIATRSSRFSAATPTDGSPKSKPNIIPRLLKATKRYTTSAASKARKLFYTALNITPPSAIPIDRYLPAEIHIQIFSYLPWETLLACSLASRIWGEILWNHGQDYSLLKANKDRYTAPRRHIGILYHKIFYHRLCVIEISKDGIASIELACRSPWEPIPFAINSSRLRHQKSNSSILSSSSSSSDDSFADVVYNDDQFGEIREMVHINPQNNFVMNDILLKLNPIYTPRPSLMARLLALLRSNELPFEDENPDATNCSINLDVIIKSTDETNQNNRTITRSISTDDEREGITYKTFLEYVAQVVIKEKELEEGEVRKFYVGFLMIKDKTITFAVYPRGRIC